METAFISGHLLNLKGSFHPSKYITGEEECQAALSLFNGRWYAGRQLQCEFSPVTRWKTAICGLFEIQQCPRGKHCTFLHVFRNPNSEFWEANRDIYLSPDRSSSSFGKNSERRERMGHHDEYYGGPRRRRRPSPTQRERSHREKKSHKHEAENCEKYSSQSRERQRDYGHSQGSLSRESQSQQNHHISFSRHRNPGRRRRSGSKERTISSCRSK
ncbi:U2 small nuclear ribonucleoprotein auxiliary factor 35 kDa subunit-related protein 2-like [Sturnira hondurensis]|uniref:U2 small nuclear ribonucleoprotein auxiliary factor 35 kDa subunit-related protein 2-like n=1 Tax=Sturnira hondurensis TaxID=192404 RepID=UPI00187993E6|nr:U2 small nuclear ribonucleoprotein auxiliary factor 35 kDa subunit-related protein 2-like [Sturnira hondurensis]